MSTLDTFLDEAWRDHVDDAGGVALRLPYALDLVTDADGMVQAAALASHVWGEHLGNWGDALKFLAALARGPGFDAGSPQAVTLRVLRAALALAGQAGDVRETLAADERIAVTGRAGMLLAAHDSDRAAALLAEAQAAAEALPEPRPVLVTRALAIAGNNTAGTLIDRVGRSEAERELMLAAAEMGLQWWRQAGTWVEHGRAELCLSRAWLAAGDPARAREHAASALAVVQAQADAPPLERFNAHEAMALAARAAGDQAALQLARQAMQAAFEAMDAGLQAECRSALAALDPAGS